MKKMFLTIGFLVTLLIFISARTQVDIDLVHDWALVGNVGEVGQSYAGHIYESDLLGTGTDIAYYKFSDGAMTTDEEGVYDLTTSGTPPSNANGITGSDYAAYFNGSTYYTQSSLLGSGITINNGFGISFWVKLDDGQPSSNQHLFAKRMNVTPGTGEYIDMYVVTDGRAFVEFAETSISYALNPVTFQDGQTGWYHIVINIDIANGFRIWVNSVLVESISSIHAIPTGGDAKDFTIGANNNTSINNFFTGNIALFQVQDIVYTQKDIDLLYSVRYAKPTTFRGYNDFGVRLLAKEDGDDDYISEISWGGMEVKRTDSFIYRYGRSLDPEDKFKMWVVK